MKFSVLPVSLAIVLIGALQPLSVEACSFMPGYLVGKPPSKLTTDAPALPRPDLNVQSLDRGFDDGDFASCSDAGILVLAFESAERARTCYVFEITRGEFPDEVIPESCVVPIDLGEGKRGFMFVWLDLPWGTRRLKPIDATFAVRAVSSQGARSDALLIGISHSGGVPWENLPPQLRDRLREDPR